MTVKITISPEVVTDISETYAWYESRRVGLGEEFLSCIDALHRTNPQKSGIAQFGLRVLPSSISPPLSIGNIL